MLNCGGGRVRVEGLVRVDGYFVGFISFYLFFMVISFYIIGCSLEFCWLGFGGPS
jgi:hypothetical protein